jgi:hypothetical protein
VGVDKIFRVEVLDNTTTNKQEPFCYGSYRAGRTSTPAAVTPLGS